MKVESWYKLWISDMVTLINIYWLETIALANLGVTLSLSLRCHYSLSLRYRPCVCSSVTLRYHLHVRHHHRSPPARSGMAICRLPLQLQLHFPHRTVIPPGTFSFQVYFVTWFYQCRHQVFPAFTEDSVTHPDLESRFCLSGKQLAFFSVAEIFWFFSHSYWHFTYFCVSIPKLLINVLSLPWL